jgi:hypothetical protein
MKKIILLLFALVAFTGAFAQDDDENAGIINLETGGKTYVLRKVDGSVLIGVQKKAIVIVHGALEEGKRTLDVIVDMMDFGDFKPGKVQLKGMNVDGGKNFATFANTGDADGPDPQMVSIESETGSFTLTNISNINIKGTTVTISGSFEFTGKNKNEDGTQKTVIVKGNFKDLHLRYVSGEIFKQ